MTVLARVWYWNGFDPSASNCGTVASSARKYSPARSESAKLTPSTEMPNPENIGRMVTGPKSENSSIRNSRSMAQASRSSSSWRKPGPITPGRSLAKTGKRATWYRHLSRSRDHAVWVLAFARTTARAKLAVDFRRLELHGFAAAAGRDLVRIVEDELGLHLVGLVVHLGAQQVQHGLGVDQDLHALVLDDLVGGADLMGIFHGVG